MAATRQQRLTRKRQDRSILDAITDKVSTLQKDLPPGDRVGCSEYLDDIREIERRIQKAENQSAELQIPEAPVGVPESFDEHVKLMFDLQVLAYKADITRISTMMFARDLSGATYPLSGIRDGFHTCSHHSNNHANMEKFSKINRYHAEMLAYFLGQTQSHTRRRRQSARPLDDPLWQQYGRRKPARPLSVAGPCCRRRIWDVQRGPVILNGRSDANVESFAYDAEQARNSERKLWR